MSSASAGGPQSTLTFNIGRREKPHLPRPRSVPPALTHTHLEPCPSFLGNQECPHKCPHKHASARKIKGELRATRRSSPFSLHEVPDGKATPGNLFPVLNLRRACRLPAGAPRPRRWRRCRPTSE